MPLEQIDAFFTGPALLCALVGLGLVVGVLTGLFGVGGSFLLNPLLIVLFGMDESLVVGSSLSFTIGTGASGAARHMRSRNVDVRSVLILGSGAVIGAVLGSWLHEFLRGLLKHDFKHLILALYLALLVLTGLLVFRGSGGSKTRRSLLQRLPLPPHVDLPHAGLVRVSLPGLVLVGLVIGVAKGLLGIGGGVLFMPLLLLVVGLSAHQAVGTSLGVVLFSSIAGTIGHAQAGNVSLWIAMSLLVGSTVGVQIGAWLCDRLHAAKLRRYFAVIVLLAAVLVAVDLARKLIGL